MLQKFKEHIVLQFPFLKEKKLLIAVSGGVDSMVLTHLFKTLNYTFSIAHCNFTLRETESDKDEQFVIETGKKFDITTFTKQFLTEDYAKTNKLSTQIAARELRYQWFQELVIKHQFDYILTAHHADDNLETFLINLTRGTGIDGLTGIPAINKNIVRPLLIFSREEIVSFAQKEHIDWREDESNSSTKYTRNKIRHQVVPILREINPSLLDSFQKTTAYLEGSQQIIKDAIHQLKNNAIVVESGVTKIDISILKQLSNSKVYLFELLKEYGFTEWNDVVQLLDAQSGKKVFSKSHRLLKNRGFLLLSKIESTTTNAEFTLEENTSAIENPISLSISKVTEIGNSSLQTIFVDADLLSFPFQIRKWKNGDFIYPLGMRGKKKLSKFFKDEKYSLVDKEATWLLTFQDQIVWIIGKRQDQRFAASKTSKNILKISVTY